MSQIKQIGNTIKQPDTIMNKTEQIDLIAKPEQIIEIEIQQEIGFTNKYKLYIHVDDITVLRICKLTNEQINLKLDPLI